MMEFNRFADDRSENLRTGALCCNLCVLIGAVYMLSTPFLLWGFVSSGFVQDGITYEATIISGWQIAGATSRELIVGGNQTNIGPQVLTWNGVSSADACDTESDIYRQWSNRYGFCQNGSFHVPKEVVQFEVFSVIAVTSLSIAFLASLTCLVGRTISAAAVSAIFTLLAFICTIIVVAAVTSSAWWTDLRVAGKGVIPLLNLDNQLVPYSLDSPLHLGLPFTTTVFNLIALLIAFSLRAHLCLATMKRNEPVVDFDADAFDKQQYTHRNDIVHSRATAVV